jgi:predicted SAM-dependent methyltransferase
MGLGIRTALRAYYRRVSKTDEKIFENYMRQHPVAKLQVGCGENILAGWLNTDLVSKAPGVFLLDATKQFPFETGQFDYVFSEHLIEHLPYEQGIWMLSECFRVTKPGGTVRITTPNIEFLADLYKSRNAEPQKRYIDWSTRSFIPQAPETSAVFVINNFLYCDWGHQFIYDSTTLGRALETVGFRRVRECQLSSSPHEELRDLENHRRMPEGFLALESMTLEADKPAA